LIAAANRMTPATATMTTPINSFSILIL
jgi:hypothetical protein